MEQQRILLPPEGAGPCRPQGDNSRLEILRALLLGKLGSRLGSYHPKGAPQPWTRRFLECPLHSALPARTVCVEKAQGLGLEELAGG